MKRPSAVLPLAVLSVLLLAAFALVGCGNAQEQASPPSTGAEDPAVDSPASGISLAPGLYDQDDGTVLAIGTLEYRDLEGGFWAIIDRSQAGGAEGKVVAVIANSADFATEIDKLTGKAVTVSGKRLDGASVRMAGPEIEAASIVGNDDTPSPAE